MRFWTRYLRRKRWRTSGFRSASGTKMTHVELVADSDVVSYLYGRGPLGRAYSSLIGERRVGITLLAVAESRVGVTYGNWGDRKIAALDAFLSRFFLLEPN